MTVATAPRFVRDLHALDELLTAAKQMACPHCHRQGTLVGHGLLTGYAERGGERQVRGRRLLCSARDRAMGCGRTFSVLLATVIARFTARAPTVAALLEQVALGLSRKAAWERVQSTAGDAPGLSLRSGYRLWDRLLAAQSAIRAALFDRTPPPASFDVRPIAQMLAHLRLAFGDSGCVLASFQLALQRRLFD
jgi:hypothetical protein